MNTTLLRSVLVTMFWFAVSTPAWATDSRSQSLLYNLAFPDQTDVFIFPQLLPDYRGIYFHLPSQISGVFGGTILGTPNSAFGVFVHRPVGSLFDQYRFSVTDGDLKSVGLLLGDSGNSTEVHLAGQIFDVMYGAKSWGLGARLHAWSEVSQQQGVLADPAVTNSTIALDANGGFRLMPGFDMRLNLGFVDTKYSSLIFRGNVGMRYLSPNESELRLVFGGELQFGVMAPKEGDNSYGVALPFKGGTRITIIPEQLFVGCLVGLDVQMYKVSGADTKIGVAIPTVEIGAEWKALDWLELRTGIKGGFGFQFSGEANENTPKSEQMAFGSGLGFPIGPFRLDAVIQYSLWQNGPYFLSGNTGLFAGVTVAYLWLPGASQPKASEPVSEISKPTPPKPREETPVKDANGLYQ